MYRMEKRIKNSGIDWRSYIVPFALKRPKKVSGDTFRSSYLSTNIKIQWNFALFTLLTIKYLDHLLKFVPDAQRDTLQNIWVRAVFMTL